MIVLSCFVVEVTFPQFSQYKIGQLPASPAPVFQDFPVSALVLSSCNIAVEHVTWGLCEKFIFIFLQTLTAIV